MNVESHSLLIEGTAEELDQMLQESATMRRLVLGKVTGKLIPCGDPLHPKIPGAIVQEAKELIQQGQVIDAISHLRGGCEPGLGLVEARDIVYGWRDQIRSQRGEQP